MSLPLERRTDMGSFQYEWWHVQSKEPTGIYTLECKAKNKENAVKQFKNWYKDDPFGIIGEIQWDTLKLDRTGYQRRF